jgi:hypothetical protein
MLALILALSMKSSAWWGNLATPERNHVEAVVDGVTPDATVTGNYTFTLTCNLPQPSTFRLNGIMVQIDGTNIQSYFGADARSRLGIPQTFTVNTATFPSNGWHELRARCFGEETQGVETGKLTELTAGHQLFLNNPGKTQSNSSHSIRGIVDSHAWYDVDVNTGIPIDYVYVQIKDVHALTDAPLSGSVPFTGIVSPSGPAIIDHWMLMVDGVAMFEYHGSTQQRTIMLDTTTLSNGAHSLQFHGHGRAPNPDGTPSNRQLAGQVEVPITVSNDGPPPPPPPPPSGTPVSAANDSFAGPLDTTKWTVRATAGSASASGGVLTITPNTGDTTTGVYVTSIDSYNFIGSRASTKVVGVVEGNINNKFTLRAPGSENEVGWYQERGNLFAYYRTNGAETEPGFLSYSPTTHAYWRVRHDGTTVFWETSADGVTYTVQAQTTATNIPFSAQLDSVQVEFNIKAFGTTGAATTAPAKYSNLNQ